MFVRILRSSILIVAGSSLLVFAGGCSFQFGDNNLPSWKTTENADVSGHSKTFTYVRNADLPSNGNSEDLDAVPLNVAESDKEKFLDRTRQSRKNMPVFFRDYRFDKGRHHILAIDADGFEMCMLLTDAPKSALPGGFPQGDELSSDLGTTLSPSDVRQLVSVIDEFGHPSAQYSDERTSQAFQEIQQANLSNLPETGEVPGELIGETWYYLDEDCRLHLIWRSTSEKTLQYNYEPSEEHVRQAARIMHLTD